MQISSRRENLRDARYPDRRHGTIMLSPTDQEAVRDHPKTFKPAAGRGDAREALRCLRVASGRAVNWSGVGASRTGR
jgi:hypothetical protein